MERPTSWADNISWSHGKHTIRSGVFFDTSTDECFDIGPARGRMTFQNFTDFLLGLSAAQNGSPSGLSNVDSVNANEGVGTQGVMSQSIDNIPPLFLQDDFKVTSRFTLNLGLRWEYLAASFDPDGQLGTVWPFPISQLPIPPASGTYIGNTVAANYDPSTINPIHRVAVRAAPCGCDYQCQQEPVPE